jgi:beta-phosphoglucomutase-like phosphatase (HAD superfamily)
VIPVAAFIFDLDGTLIDPRETWQVRLTALAAAGQPQAVSRSPYVGDRVHKLLARAFDLEDGRPQALAGTRPPPSPSSAPTTASTASTNRLYPGVLETLEHFRDKRRRW